MFDNLNLVFPIPENHVRLEHNTAREFEAKPYPADEISLQTGYWHADLANYFLVQFGTF